VLRHNSVLHANGFETGAEFADGTQLTGFGCTIQIRCP
jgi:hypothetical protein